MKFRSKVVEIDAWEFTSLADLPTAPPWLTAAVKHVHREPEPGEVVPFASPIDGSDLMAIGTLEGRMIAGTGDWIIRGLEGELYPCKPSVFERKYEIA
jgi:hypothetical protein